MGTGMRVRLSHNLDRLPLTLHRTAPFWVLVDGESRSYGHREVSTSQAPDTPIVIFDGRLDDREALASRLGADPRASEDVDLLRHAWRRWGRDTPEHVLGDFALVVWDTTEQLLLVARDLGGSRPVFYTYEPGRCLRVATDIRHLVERSQSTRRLDLRYLRGVFEDGYGFVHPEHTLLEGVKRLPPGHRLTFDGNALRVERWWNAERLSTRQCSDDEEYAEEAREVVRAAVACRATATGGSMGAHVSGGLDCSTLAVLAHRELVHAQRAVTAISWSPPYEALAPGEHRWPPHIDERSLVESVTASAGMPLRYTYLTVEDLLRHARRDHTIEPTDTLDVEMAASRVAADVGAQTIISGWGGDEFIAFNGRGYLADLARRGQLRRLYRTLRQRREVMGIAVPSQLIASVMKPLLPRPPAGAKRLVFPAVVNPDLADAIARAEPLPRPHLREVPGVRNMQLSLLWNGHLAHRIESWASHGSDVGIRYVYPLLDRRVIEFALSVPPHLFLRNGWKRWLFRAAAEGILPDAVRWHKHKIDPAAFEQSARLFEAARQPLRTQLLERSGHPLVDTAVLARTLYGPEAPKAAARQHAESNTVAVKPDDTAWLAYVDPVARW